MEKYVISFGNSAKYRISADSEQLSELDYDIQKYLVKKFPQISDLGFFDHMTVTKLDPSNETDYASYPEFNASSLDEIKQVLSTEVEDEESLRRLNSNAPWGSV